MALTDSHISAWHMDEASGNALDAHSTNDLTETSGTIDSATGKLGNARDFEEGDTEFFAHTDNAELSTGDIDFTLAVWVNLESKPANAGIVCKDEEYYLTYRGGIDRFEFQAYGAAGFASGSAVDANNFGSPSTGTWYFIVVWHDSVANTINIQVNDGTVNTTSHSAGVYDGTGSVRVGDNGFNQYWDGLIDELNFWKRVLTSDERTSVYNAGAGLAYPFSVAGHPAMRRLGLSPFCRPVEIGHEGVLVF